jgi:bla regulator protein BlaR1
MRLSALWMNSWITALNNHMWQSTLVVGIAWTLALVPRSNHARTRYWVWMAASTKFLVPFSLFVAAGERLRSIMTPSIKTPALTATISQVTEPFSQIQFFPAAATDPAFQASDWITPILVSLWALGSAVVALSWLRKWQQIRTAMHGATPLSIG